MVVPTILLGREGGGDRGFPWYELSREKRPYRSRFEKKKKKERADTGSSLTNCVRGKAGEWNFCPREGNQINFPPKRDSPNTRKKKKTFFFLRKERNPLLSSPRKKQESEESEQFNFPILS